MEQNKVIDLTEEQKTNLSAFARTLQRESHVLKDRPDLLWQQLFNRLQWEDEPLPSLLESEAARRDDQWTRRETQFHESEALIQTLDGHVEPVDACLITPDGENIVTLSESEKSIRVWDFNSRQLKSVIETEYVYFKGIVVTPDGSRILSACGVFADDDLDDLPDEESWHGVSVWDLQTGKLFQIMKGHKNTVNDLCMTLDGRKLVTASDDNTIKVWDFENGQEILTLEGNLERMNAVAVTPGNQFIIGLAEDIFSKNLIVWDLQSGSLLSIIDDLYINSCLLFATPDGRYIITSGPNGTRIWDLQSGALIHDLDLEGVNAIAVTPDSRYLVSALEDTTIRVLDLENGREMLRLEGHTESGESVAVSPDGKHIVSGSFDGTLKMWELEIGIDQIKSDAHSERVNTVAITPDGKLAVSGSADKSLKVWDLYTRKQRYTLEGHTAEISALAVTSDGQRVISASHDNTLRVWDLDSGEELFTLKGHLKPVVTVAVIPGGTHAISGSEDHTLKVWNLENGQLEQILEGHVSTPHSIEVTPDGSRAVSIARDIKVWDLEKRELIHTMTDILEERFALTPDGKHIVIWPRVYDLERGELQFQFIGLEEYDEEDGSIDAVKITLDGNYAIFVNGSYFNELMVCDLNKRKLQYSLSGHEDKLTTLAATSDGSYVVSGSRDNSLRVWDLENGKEIALIAGIGLISCCAITPDGKKIVAGDVGGQVHILELENFTPGAPIVTAQKEQSGNLVIQCTLCTTTFEIETSDLGCYIFCRACGAELKTNLFTNPIAGQRPAITEKSRIAIDSRLAKESDPQWLADQDFVVTKISMSSDGRQIVAGSFDATLRVWDLESGDQRCTLDGHRGIVRDVVFTPDNHHIISASSDATIKIWKLENGEALHTLKAHNFKVWAMAVSPDGRQIISAGEYEKTIKVWDLAAGTQLYTITGFKEPVYRFAVTPDSLKLVAVSYDNTISVWNLGSGEHLFTLGGHTVSISVAITPDSRYLLSASDKLRMWNLENGELIRTLDTNEEGSKPIVIMSDGQRAVSGTFDDNLIKVWDLDSGKVLRTLAGHTDWIDAIALIPDSNQVISSSLDHTLKVWDIESGEELRTLKRHQKRIPEILITPDGSHAISRSEDNTIRIWDLLTGESRLLFPRSEWND